MTKEDKELLLKDLCGRLPYGVKFPTKKCCRATHDFIDVVCTIQSINNNGTCRTEEDDVDFPFAWSVKPYLFPLSSMTGEQSKEYHELISGMLGTSALINFEALEDFFHKNHLDYRGLIPKGLALDATRLGIYENR